MTMQAVGGFPEPRFFNVPTAGIKIQLPARTIFFQVSNTGGNAVRVYFTLAAFTADAAGGAPVDGDQNIELPATTGYIEGPYELDAVWFRAITAPSTIVLVAVSKKG